jgi:hypothetical protein
MKKHCNKCDSTKPVIEFYKHPSTKDGLYPVCKACHRATRRKSYKNNKHKEYAYKKANRKKINEQNKARFLERYHNDPEFRAKHTEGQRKWAKENRNKVRQYARNYYQKNRAELCEYSKQYRESNPIYRLKQNYRRSLLYVENKYNVDLNYDAEDLLGCTFEQYLDYLLTSVPGATWETYGTKWVAKKVIPPRLINYQNVSDTENALHFSAILPAKRELE